jgi:hypothetical protein
LQLEVAKEPLDVLLKQVDKVRWVFSPRQFLQGMAASASFMERMDSNLVLQSSHTYS